MSSLYSGVRIKPVSISVISTDILTISLVFNVYPEANKIYA